MIEKSAECLNEETLNANTRINLAILHSRALEKEKIEKLMSDSLPLEGTTANNLHNQ